MWKRKTYSPKTHNIKALIFGDSWTWKTTFWWTAKNAVFLSAEWGLLSLWKDVSMYDIKSLNDLKIALLDLKESIKDWTCPFDTVVIDSITEINDIVRSSIEAELDWGNMTFKERWELSKIMQWILRWFRDLPLHVLFIAHEKAEKDDDRLIKYKPSLNWKAADSICYYMDIVWYTQIVKTEDWVDYNLVVEPKTYAPTKCRWWFITDKTPADFEIWKQIIEWSSKNWNSSEDTPAIETVMNPSSLLEAFWLDPSFEAWLHAIKTIADAEKDEVQEKIDALREQIKKSDKLSSDEKKKMNKLADNLLTIY